MDANKVTIELIAQFLDARQWKYRVEGDGCIETGYGGVHAIIPITIALYGEQLQRLAVRLRLPLVVPEARRTQMAEVVVRVNDGLDLGRFDLDLSMGRLSCLATMPIADGDVTKEQFDALLVGAMVTTDRYFRAFARLLYGDDLSPAEVVAEVEMAR